MSKSRNSKRAETDWELEAQEAELPSVTMDFTIQQMALLRF